MLVAIRVWRDVADDHPSLLADPFESRIPAGTDEYKPRRGHAALLRN
jgi:hypothetical protein